MSVCVFAVILSKTYYYKHILVHRVTTDEIFRRYRKIQTLPDITGSESKRSNDFQKQGNEYSSASQG